MCQSVRTVLNVFSGIGFGLMYLPSIVMVGYYFDKKRSLATGIAVCGSSTGIFVLAPLASALVDAYGWKGTNVVLAGIVLNGIVVGAFYRPLLNTASDFTTLRSFNGSQMLKLMSPLLDWRAVSRTCPPDSSPV
jgi:MFS family permease